MKRLAIAFLLWLGITSQAFAVLALDGSVVTGVISGAATTTVVSGALSTTGTTDVLIALVGSNNDSQVTVGSVAGCGLTWTNRAAQHFLDSVNFNYIDYEIWWAPATTTLSSCAVTATFAAAATSESASIAVFAVSGANTSSPFDPASTAFKTNQTTTGDTPQTTITTTNANDFLFAGVFSGSGTPAVWTTQASFTTLGNLNCFSGSPNFVGCYTQGEYQIVSSTQSNLTIGFTDASNTYVLFADAIEAAGAAAVLPPQRTSTGAGK